MRAKINTVLLGLIHILYSSKIHASKQKYLRITYTYMTPNENHMFTIPGR